VDRRRIELQLRAILITYRIEQRRRDSPTMEGFRDRARSILHSLAQEVRPHPDLEAALVQARRELEGEEPSPMDLGAVSTGRQPSPPYGEPTSDKPSPWSE